MYHRFFLFVLFVSLSVIGASSPIDSLYLDSLHRKATTLHLEDYYADAYFIYKKNLNLQEEAKDADEELLARTHRNMGMCLVELNQIDKAEKHLTQAIESYSKIVAKNKGDSIYKILVNRLGICFQHRSRAMLFKGDFTEAINDTNRAMEQFKIADKTINIIRINNIIANIYIDSGDFDQAEKVCIDAIEQYAKSDLSPDIFADIYHTLAVVYDKKANYKKAETYYKKAIDLTEFESDLAKTYVSIAEIYTKSGDFSKAKKYLNQALQIKQKIQENSSFSSSYAATFENFGDLNVAQNDFDTALNNYQKSLINLTDNFRNQDTNTNPKVKESPYVYNKPDLLRVLDLKAQTALEIGNIDLAHNTYKDLDNWINEFYKDLNTNESKLTWIARAHATYSHAIQVALAKKDEEKAFEYAEKAHAVLLWQSLSQQAARSLLSEDDREKMDDLTAKIRQADQEYYYEEITIDELRALEREREDLEKTFEQKYETYAQRKYQPEATTVSDIQSNIINDDTAFIEYYRTDEVLYIFTITKNGLNVSKKRVEGLADDISKFVKNISRKNMNLESYHALSYKLYTQLIPFALHSNDNITRLVIVPDREIGTLPFAALATQATSGALNKNTPFLTKKYTTNYLYSAGSYLQLQQHKADQKYCFAGIAPIEYKMEKWNEKPLQFSEEELNGIKPLHWSWQREILMKEQATKAAFESIIKEGYRTIQVSTHAVFDNNKGQIIFHDSALNQDEIDQLEINTHRLILSACETGVGTQNQGEGILSLGWNFAYKGVPSITMTHWSVSDNSTKNIMIHYHEKLNDGTPADQALQAAQQNYLANIASDTQANPYYWAAFFHTGNTK